MNLRARLIVVFFLLSVVPVGAVTYYTYASNAEAMRDAARVEAELLAAELSGRMRTVTAQLSQRVESLMELPEPPKAPAVVVARLPAPPRVRNPVAVAAQAQAATRTPASPPAQPASAQTARAQGTAGGAAVSAPDVRPSASDLDLALGDLAQLINNIEVRGLRPRRPRGLPGDGRFPGPPGGVVPPEGGSVTPPPGGRRPRPDLAGAAGGSPDARPGGPFAGVAEEPVDPNRIRIDLRGVRRELFDELVPDRTAFDALPPEERQKVFTQIEQRMQGVAQGITVLQKALASRALEVRTDVPTTPDLPAGGPPAAPAPPAPAAAPSSAPALQVPTPAPPAPAAPPRATRPRASPAAPDPAPPDPTPPPAPAMRRSTSLSGGRLAVRVERGGEIVGQVNADVDLPKLLATVFATTSRDRGELPFAVGEGGELYTASASDKSQLQALRTSATSAGSTTGTTVLPDWIVATTPDPNGSRLTFGIARPVGEALQDLRATSARNAALGLGFIGLALIVIVPLSGRLTRNLDTLSAGVRRIAEGDYSARVAVRSTDEIGRLAVAFNQMAGDVEEHQRAAVSQERLRRELELGRQIQHDMLPRAPLLLGLTEIKGVSVPAREVGGDFFNYFTLRDGTIALLVGDVSGKGVGAALLMANLQAALRTRLSLGQDLASLAQELDVEVDRTTPGPVYSTLFVGIFDPAARRLRSVNAGHNPQYILRTDGRLERMESTGRPIGLLSGGDYIEQQVQLSAGDVLFFYTDGCVEAEDASGEMFGSEQLERVLAASAGLGADEVMVAVESAVSRFRSGVELTDDATMMVVKVG